MNVSNAKLASYNSFINSVSDYVTAKNYLGQECTYDMYLKLLLIKREECGIQTPNQYCAFFGQDSIPVPDPTPCDIDIPIARWPVPCSSSSEFIVNSMALNANLKRISLQVKKKLTVSCPTYMEHEEIQVVPYADIKTIFRTPLVNGDKPFSIILQVDNVIGTPDIFILLDPDSVNPNVLDPYVPSNLVYNSSTKATFALALRHYITEYLNNSGIVSDITVTFDDADNLVVTTYPKISYPGPFAAATSSIGNLRFQRSVSVFDAVKIADTFDYLTQGLTNYSSLPSFQSLCPVSTTHNVIYGTVPLALIASPTHVVPNPGWISNLRYLPVQSGTAKFTSDCSKFVYRPSIPASLQVANLEWTGPSNFKSSNPLLSNPAPGTYTLSILFANGCVIREELVVT